MQIGKTIGKIIILLFFSSYSAQALAVISVELAMTVGYDDQVCPSGDTVGFNAPNTQVWICYEFTNTGDEDITSISLSNDLGNNIFTNFPYTLVPTATVWVGRYETISVDTTVTGTLTVSNPGGSSATDTDTVDIIYDAQQLQCDKGPVEFEEMLHPSWQVTNISAVRWSTTKDASACSQLNENETGASGFAACADADFLNGAGNNYDTSLRTAVDVTGRNYAKLKFRWRHRPLNGSTFEVSVSSDNANYSPILSNTTGNPSGSQGDSFELDISEHLAGGANQLWLNFRYLGTALDWYAHVDSVELVCTDPSICFPIRAHNGKAALICL